MNTPRPPRGPSETPDHDALVPRLREESPASDPARRSGTGGGSAGGRSGGGPDNEATGPADGSPGWSHGLLTLLILLLGVWASSADRHLPAAEPANAPATTFSSARALTQLVELARAPRPVGSPEHARVRELIVARLEALGLQPQIQRSLSLRREGQLVRSVPLQNVVARLAGTDPTGAIVLTAHYDSEPLTPGAGDDGTGVVAILEAVRALQAGADLRNDVIVLITDGEEMGLLGARAFVEEHPWMADVSVVLALEMRGGGGPVHMFETGAENGWIVRAMMASDPHPSANSLSVEMYRRLSNDTDFTPFREAGVQGLNFAGIDRAWMYHEATDVPENVQEETIQHMGMRLLALTRELGERDLSSVHAPDLVYETLPVVGIVAYPVAWTVPITLGLLALWIAAAMLSVTRGRGRWKGIPAGLALVLIAGGVAWLLGVGLLRWLPRFHPEYPSMTPAFYGAGWYVAGLAAGALAGTIALFNLGRRRFSTGTLTVGALIPMMAAALLLAFVAPLTAIVVQGPLLAGVLAAGIAGIAGVGGEGEAGRRTATWARLVALLLALVVLAFMVPLIEGLWVTMSFRVAPLIGVVVVLALVCLLPALEDLTIPNRWWAPAAALAVAAALVGTRVLLAGPSPDRPVHSTLLYVADGERDETFWATLDDPGFRWADDRVGPFTGERRLDDFLIRSPYRTARAPTFTIPAPLFQSEGPAPERPASVARVHIRSEAGAEIVALLLREEDGGRIIAVNGIPVPRGDPVGGAGAGPGGEADRVAVDAVTRLIHQGAPEDGLTLDIALPDGVEPVPVTIVEHHLRPTEYVSPEAFSRPSHLIPSRPGRSDRAVIRTPTTLSRAPVSNPVE